jgi:hypothetical protein
VRRIVNIKKTSNHAALRFVFIFFVGNTCKQNLSAAMLSGGKFEAQPQVNDFPIRKAKTAKLRGFFSVYFRANNSPRSLKQVFIQALANRNRKLHANICRHKNKLKHLRALTTFDLDSFSHA